MNEIDTLKFRILELENRIEELELEATMLWEYFPSGSLSDRI